MHMKLTFPMSCSSDTRFQQQATALRAAAASQLSLSIQTIGITFKLKHHLQGYQLILTAQQQQQLKDCQGQNRDSQMACQQPA